MALNMWRLKLRMLNELEFVGALLDDGDLDGHCDLYGGEASQQELGKIEDKVQGKKFSECAIVIQTSKYPSSSNFVHATMKRPQYARTAQRNTVELRK